MATFFFFIIPFFMTLDILYPLICAALYLVYKATGGKLSFCRWWEKMDF